MATTLRTEDVVGKSVRVYWPDEDAWFPGEVEAYDPDTGQHKVSSIVSCLMHEVCFLQAFHEYTCLGSNVPLRPTAIIV